MPPRSVSNTKTKRATARAAGRAAAACLQAAAALLARPISVGTSKKKGGGKPRRQEALHLEHARSASSRPFSSPSLACITRDMLSQFVLSAIQTSNRAIRMLRGPPRFEEMSTTTLTAKKTTHPPNPSTHFLFQKQASLSSSRSAFATAGASLQAPRVVAVSGSRKEGECAFDEMRGESFRRRRAAVEEEEDRPSRPQNSSSTNLLSLTKKTPLLRSAPPPPPSPPRLFSSRPSRAAASSRRRRPPPSASR